MTTPEPTPTPAPAPEVPPAQGDPKPETPPAKPETDWRAEAKKWETRAKENKSAADKLAEIENANKSEAEKLQARAEAAEKRAADLEAAEQQRIAKAEAARQVADWKAQIVADPKFEGVPASALRGSTEDELREHAAELKALLPDPNVRRGGGAYVPAEGRQQTGSGSADPRQVFADILKNA
jgi:hypothetical protein